MTYSTDDNIAIAKKLIGRMCAEDCRDLSDSEIVRVFTGCVKQSWCIIQAKRLRDCGALTQRHLDSGVIL